MRPFLATWEDVRRYNAIQDVLPLLTDRQRECWLLKHSRGMSLAQIAETLEINKSTVKEHVDKAEKRLLLLVEERMAA
jgi:positive control factor